MKLPGVHQRLGRKSIDDSALAGDYTALSIVGADVADQAIEMNELAVAAVFGARNFLINPCGLVCQRGTTIAAVADAAFIADRWRVVADTAGDVDFARTDIPSADTMPDTGAQSAIALTTTVTDHKFGIVQSVENRDSFRLLGKTGGVVSLSFWAKQTGDGITSISAYIYTSTATSDLYTKDAILDWDVAGSAPTVSGTGSVIEGSLVDSALTTSWVQFKLENVALDGSSDSQNVHVIIFTNDEAYNIGDIVEITDVSLVVGPRAVSVSHRPFAEEIRLCERFYRKTFALETTPAQWSAGGDVPGHNVAMMHSSTVSADINEAIFRFRHPERINSPAAGLTTYNPAAANASARNNTDGTDSAFAVDTDYRGERGTKYGKQLAAGEVLDQMRANFTADGEPGV